MIIPIAAVLILAVGQEATPTPVLKKTVAGKKKTASDRITPPAPHPGGVHSGEWVIRWTDAEATAENRTTKERRTIYENEYENCCTTTDVGPCPSDYFYRTGHRILSTIGGIVSYSEGYEGSGGVHPIYGYSYATINLSDESAADITQIADQDAVLKALLAEPIIRDHLSGERPTSLFDLVEALGIPCDIDFHSLRSAFRLKALQARTMSIEFGLGHGCETARGSFTTFTISLPIPSKLRSLIRESGRNLPAFPQEDTSIPAPTCTDSKEDE